MILVGCDLHTRKQQVALLNTDTGELWDQELSHDGDAIERFYATLPPPVTVGIESTGYSLWFHALLQRLGHTLLVGEAAKIRAMVVRKIKTDRRDARHLRDLLKDDRFPVVWIPDPATRDLRALIKHRLRLVRIRTMVKNGLQAIALNQRLALGPSLWSRAGLAQLHALVLPPHTRRRRDDSLELLQWLTGHINELDLHVATAAAADPNARRLMIHPDFSPLFRALPYACQLGAATGYCDHVSPASSRPPALGVRPPDTKSRGYLVRGLQLDEEQVARGQPLFIEDLDDPVETIVLRKITENPSRW
jgi:transposase